MTYPSKPELGDLVNWRGEIGIVKQARGATVQVCWVKPWMEDGRLIDASWLRPGFGLRVISRA